MKRIIFLIILCCSFSAPAENLAGIRTKIMEAREALLVLLNNKTQRGINHQKIVKFTINEVSKSLYDVEVPAIHQVKLDGLRTIWRAFKKTREDEIVPAILAGKEEIANKLALGIQKDRLDQMLNIINELQAKTISKKY